MYKNMTEIDLAIEENTKKYIGRQITQKEYLQQISNIAICYNFLKHKNKQKKKTK